MGHDPGVRVLVATDRFDRVDRSDQPDDGARSLTAAEAAEALAEGWARSAPYDVVDRMPLSDGGPGFLDVLHPALGGELAVVTVHGPLGEPVPARVLVADGTAYVEAAEAVGLHLVAPADRDPAGSSTEGVGELLAAAVGTGAARVVVGVGGTATTDGGRGLVDALDGLDAARALAGGVELVAATATDAPLMGHSGAAHGFAGGKGADRPTREALETTLREWATATDGGLAVRPGAGAGGGIGFGLLLLGAERVIAIDRYPYRLQMAKERAGATDVINYEEASVQETLLQLTAGRGPDACIDAVGMEAHGHHAMYAYDRAKQALMLETDRPLALREAIMSCRNGVVVSVIGVYGGFIDKFPMGSVMNRSLTIRTGQCHVQRYLRPLLERIERGEIDPSFVITHRLELEDAPRGYEMFLHKEDGCEKVVLST